MNVLLVSKNKKLDQLCQEATGALAGANYTSVSELSGASPADVVLRDVEGPAAMPHGLDAGEEHRSVFLVSPEDLGAFHRRLGAARVRVLLKPVKRAALSECLARACEDGGERGGAERDPHRAERDELLECLLLASLRLQQSSLDRTNFLARALHDFRAPLTAASGYCALLLEQPVGPLNSEQVEIVRRMRHSIDRLSKMARTMFQLSIGEIEEAETCLEAGDISGSIDQAVYEVMPLADQRGIEVSVRVERPEDTLYFDASQIEQVLLNLLENACKFTPVGGTIEVRGYPALWTGRSFRFPAWDGQVYRPAAADDRPNAYRVDVSDSGPGVPRERMERIFEQWVSYSGPQDRSGTGLGLATCRMILSAHEGDIFVDSRGEGATFSFVLPFIRREARDETGHGAGDELLTSVSR